MWRGTMNQDHYVPRTVPSRTGYVPGTSTHYDLGVPPNLGTRTHFQARYGSAILELRVI